MFVDSFQSENIKQLAWIVQMCGIFFFPPSILIIPFHGIQFKNQINTALAIIFCKVNVCTLIRISKIEFEMFQFQFSSFQMFSFSLLERMPKFGSYFIQIEELLRRTQQQKAWLVKCFKSTHKTSFRMKYWRHTETVKKSQCAHEN